MTNDRVCRHAVISRISDARIVAEMDISSSIALDGRDDCVIIDVKVAHKGSHMNGETHHKQLSLRKDGYYNLPQHLRSILKEEKLSDSTLFSSPIESGGHASPMVFDMLNAIRNQLSKGYECVDLDRYLNDGQFSTK
ncbi:MAG: hypothetical protein KAG53_09440 [Endozoicomonadaceae bacterium]|nr:hypothetical protein [Endozoicomonadaceae bacterium]